jgi:hypothetical protein
MLRPDHDPAAPAVRARVNSRSSAVWPPASATALLRRQLQHEANRGYRGTWLRPYVYVDDALGRLAQIL